MAKLVTYLFMISFITVGLYWCVPGIQSSEITLLGNILNPESYTQIDFYRNFIAVGIKGFISAAAVLFVGYVMSRPDLAVTAGITTYIGATYFSALFKAYQEIVKANNQILNGLAILFIGVSLIVGCVILVDWWRGRD